MPGLFIGAIKFLSVFTWFFYQPVASVLTGDDFSTPDVVTIFAIGLIGTVIAIIGWPIVVYNVLIGTASLPAVLFFPWVNPH